MISEEVLIVWEYELMDRGVLSYGLVEKKSYSQYHQRHIDTRTSIN